jgi:hypothetical protein
MGISKASKRADSPELSRSARIKETGNMGANQTAAAKPTFAGSPNFQKSTAELASSPDGQWRHIPQPPDNDPRWRIFELDRKTGWERTHEIEGCA